MCKKSGGFCELPLDPSVGDLRAGVDYIETQILEAHERYAFNMATVKTWIQLNNFGFVRLYWKADPETPARDKPPKKGTLYAGMYVAINPSFDDLRNIMFCAEQEIDSFCASHPGADRDTLETRVQGDALRGVVTLHWGIQVPEPLLSGRDVKTAAEKLQESNRPKLLEVDDDE